jgi:hypothetical protein
MAHHVSPGEQGYQFIGGELRPSTPTVDCDLAGVGPVSKAGRPPLMIRCCAHNRRSDGGRRPQPRGRSGLLAGGPGGVAGPDRGPVWAGRATLAGPGVGAGLLADLPPKNCWTLAEYAGDPSPDGLQHLLARAVWDPDGVRDDLRDDVVEHLGDPGRCWWWTRPGTSTRAPPRWGCSARTAAPLAASRCPGPGVLLVYASDGGHAVIDRELSLPRSWARDRVRRQVAGIPAQVGFATKPTLAMTMICRALDAGVPAAWVAGDEVDGADPKLEPAWRAAASGRS